MKNADKLGKWIKPLAIVVFIAAVVLAVYLVIKELMPGLLPVLEHGDEAEIEAYVRSFGTLGSIVLMAVLQFLQVVSIICPGLPIQVASGIIFGVFEGYLICHLSYIAANMAVFLVVRRLGGTLGEAVATGKRGSRLQFLKNAEYPQFTVFFGCMLPILPNGFVPYIAARTKISAKSFLVTMTVGSFPTVFLLCAVGNRLLAGQFIYAAGLLGVVILLMILTYIFRERIITVAKAVRARFGSRGDKKE